HRLLYPRNLRKHPHGRGEDWCRCAVATVPWETPPRAWGRPSARASARSYWGNTPTGVGKTLTGTPKRGCWRKHPHGRGEDIPDAGWPIWEWETPPRAWGRRRNQSAARKSSGNTPTGVGKTMALS